MARHDGVNPYQVACPLCSAAVAKLCFRMRAGTVLAETRDKVHPERLTAAIELDVSGKAREVARG